MRIDLNIEHLVLDGFHLPAAERPRLQMAVEQELARLIERGGLPASLASEGTFHSLRGSDLPTRTGSVAELGRQIARSVYRGMGPEERSR